jgi:undecaprenyl-diphosphatase
VKKWLPYAIFGGLAFLTVGWLLSMRVTQGSGEENAGAETYRDITSLASDSPSWLQSLGEIISEAGILVCLVLFFLGYWKARSNSHQAMALALVAPIATCLTYVLSELLKGWLQEERPCRAVTGVRIVAECPEPGDWSFPSNHSVIVAASVATLFVFWRTAALLALPIAVLTAFSRVFIGVHYLHDVVAGCLMGAVVAFVVLKLLVRPGEWAVTRLREYDRLRPVLVASKPAAEPVASESGVPR